MNCNFYRMLFRLTTLSKNQEEPGEEILGIHLHDPEMSYWMIKRKLDGAQLFTVILKTFIIASPSTTNKELVENLYQFVRIPENPNLSEVGVSFTYVQNRKERRGLNTFKVHKCPNWNKHQNLVAKTKAWELTVADRINMSDSWWRNVKNTDPNKLDVAPQLKTKKLSKFSKQLLWQTHLHFCCNRNP